MLKIALLQMVSHGFDQEANKEKGEIFCRQAAAMNADIALFPEMWNIGYQPYDKRVFDEDFDPSNPEFFQKRESWQQRAIRQDDEFIQHYQKLAKELGLAIAITYLEKWDPAPRNTLSLINRHGEIMLTYAKVHTCDFSLEAACTPGDDFQVCDLDTKQGNIKIGSMICFDREFPESARILMLKGAEIILVPNSCEIEQNRRAQFRTRAYENMTAIAMTNYASPQENGHSLAFDGIAFDKQGSRDPLVVEAGESEGVYVANFDIQKLRDYRSYESWGNAYRKPRSYLALTSTDVMPPFLRKNARR